MDGAQFEVGGPRFKVGGSQSDINGAQLEAGGAAVWSRRGLLFEVDIEYFKAVGDEYLIKVDGDHFKVFNGHS